MGPVAVFALAALAVPAAGAQPVSTARAGVVVYFEGQLYEDGQAVAPLHGRFPEMRVGSEWRTGEGRVEILLGPETLLWLGPDSRVRMQRSSLEDARVELAAGTAMARAGEMKPGIAVTLTSAGTEVRMASRGFYRIDGAATLTVIDGRAQLVRGTKCVEAEAPKQFALATASEVRGEETDPDGLERWVMERQRANAALKKAAAPGMRRTRARAQAYPNVMVEAPPRAR
jgi:hypothetical protein